ncbi:MAG TPA: NUDIX domain-containing protein [Anaerolineae bacterium]|nr:NUDIX domain-containing protein [Anaerolineae bacterium]
MPLKEEYRAAGGVLTRDDGKLFLVLERPGRPEVRLPKGHIEAGETTAQAAVREVQEETGYADIAIAADLGSITHSFYVTARDMEVTRTESYFLMRLIGEKRYDGPQFAHENFRRRWIDCDEAERLLTYEVEREFARRAKAALMANTSGETRA